MEHLLNPTEHLQLSPDSCLMFHDRVFPPCPLSRNHYLTSIGLDSGSARQQKILPPDIARILHRSISDLEEPCKFICLKKKIFFFFKNVTGPFYYGDFCRGG
ncbi:hypothetical protein JTE90_028516 [Oedothorax gibbosus]|uniref:Uncharacterized protein n=1 Tax=Oedothorax gibbosus TaxID=931172 RepID=A0AAV6VX80_9ARAC|nr:hypothetical protein JTE90_028516 [Oedothorax gibbosus]